MTDISNYRPVSCVSSASKVLESIVLAQLSAHFENNSLLPFQQHGFRASRSTTTALTSMIAEWVKNHEAGLHTGVLLWDLSSAFDTIDVDVLCRKLSLYGVNDCSVRWFRSFLTNRQQCVQVGYGTSRPKFVSVGCPQGCLLSPLLFLIYTADIELWLKDVAVHGYADDTSMSVAAVSEEDVVRKLEADAARALRFMASNSLVANPMKTGFLLIRAKGSAQQREVLVGNALIKEESHHRILGIVVNNKLSWDEHVNGGLVQQVNRRVGALKRLSYHIPRKYLPEIASAIVASKVRYGVSVYGSVRITDSDPKPIMYHDLQVALNNAMRIATGNRLSDRVSVSNLSLETNIPTLNRMAAGEKLILVWQSLHDPKSPLRDVLNSVEELGSKTTRARTRGDIQPMAKTSLGHRNFPHSVVCLWNKVDPSLRNIETKCAAKRKIREIINALPL